MATKEKSRKAFTELFLDFKAFTVKDILSAVKKSIVYGLGKLAVLRRYMLSIKKMIAYSCNRAF